MSSFLATGTAPPRRTCMLSALLHAMWSFSIVYEPAAVNTWMWGGNSERARVWQIRPHYDTQDILILDFMFPARACLERALQIHRFISVPCAAATCIENTPISVRRGRRRRHRRCVHGDPSSLGFRVIPSSTTLLCLAWRAGRRVSLERYKPCLRYSTSCHCNK